MSHRNTQTQRDARTREAYADYAGAAALWRTAAAECPEGSREFGYCTWNAEACERMAAKAKPREATHREMLDAVARALWPAKGERFTYSAESMVEEIRKLRWGQVSRRPLAAIAESGGAR